MSLKLMSPVLSVIRIVIMRQIIMSKVIIGIVTVSKNKFQANFHKIMKIGLADTFLCP
jgi:hypothetical protein